MRTGVRGHDVPSESPQDLCQKLQQLGVREIQLVAHKSFPDFEYSEKEVCNLANLFQQYGIRVAIYGCYIDPLTEEGRKRFLEHVAYAKILNAGAIATESAVGITDLQEDETVYGQLINVFKEFTACAEEQGVRMAIETVAVHPICSPKKTKRLLQDVNSDNLYVILDPVNLMRCENDPLLEKRIEEAIDLYGDRIIAVHWKQSQVNDQDLAIRFLQRTKEAVLITEGLTGADIEKVINQSKNL